MQEPILLWECEHCGHSSTQSPFCGVCGVLRGQTDPSIVRATRLRRLSGALLEVLLMLVTLYVGWLIWLAFAARRSQSPAKQLLGMYILTEEGVPVSAGRVWLREIVIEGLLFGLIGSFVFGLVGLVDALWILWDPNHQTLHDKLASTVVIHAADSRSPLPDVGEWRAPTAAGGVDRNAGAPTSAERRLRELNALLDGDLISAQEYTNLRQRILDRI